MTGRRWLVLLAALLVGVVACGTRSEEGESVDGNDGTDRTGEAVDGPGVSADEIRIGITAPLSGPLGFVGEETVQPITAFFDMLNEQGGIDGRMVRIISYDDAADPTQVLANMQRLVEQDDVFLVFGAFIESALEFLKNENVPAFVFGGSAPPYSSQFPNVFPVVGNALTFQQEGAYALWEEEGIQPERVAIMYDTTVIDERGYIDQFTETWETLGAEVVSTDAFTVTDGDCTALAQEMQSLDVQYWDFQSPGAWIPCVFAMEQLGWRPELGMGGWVAALPGFVAPLGPLADGIWAPSTADVPETGEPREQTDAHTEYLEQASSIEASLAKTGGTLESPQTIGMWVAAQLTADALEEIAPTFTREAFIEFVQGVEGYDPGLQPPIESLAPDCKRGSPGSWWAFWEFDEATGEITRTPSTGYITDPFEDQGECFVTEKADEIVGAG